MKKGHGSGVAVIWVDEIPFSDTHALEEGVGEVLPNCP